MNTSRFLTSLVTLVFATVGTTSVQAQPPRMDMARLTSEAVEPDGPGTPLGQYADVHVAPAPGLPTHTMFYPQNAEGISLPVLIWGNGACRNDGRNFSRTLTKVASHGFFVIAVGEYEARQGAPATTGAQMVEAMDWLEDEPALDAAIAQQIDADNIAVVGQSCGGLTTLEASRDPRVDTIGVVNSGVLNEGSGPGMSLSSMTKADLALLHKPAL